MESHPRYGNRPGRPRDAQSAQGSPSFGSRTELDNEYLPDDELELQHEWFDAQHDRAQGHARSPFGGESFEDQAAGRRPPWSSLGERRRRRSRRDLAFGDPLEKLDATPNDLDYSPLGSTGHRGRGPKGYRRSDERILEDINERLTQHDRIDASDIEVRVEEGDVTLSGQVDSRTAKRLAEDVAYGVSGVIDVQNNLRVPRNRDQASAQRGKDSRSDTDARPQK